MTLGGVHGVSARIQGIQRSTAMVTAPLDEPSRSKPHGLRLPDLGAMVGCLAGLLASGLQGVRLGVAAAALVLWGLFLAVGSLVHGSCAAPEVRSPGRAGVLAFAAVSAASVGGLVTADGLVAALVAIGVSSGVATAWVVVRRARRARVRVLLIGDRDGMAAQTALWAGVSDVEVVAIRPCTAREGFGVALGDLRSEVSGLAVDTVVVSPGAGFSSEDLQRLSWSLDSTNATLAIGGVDRFAPHRLCAGRLAGVPIMGVMPGRRSRLEYSAKAALDSVAAAVMLCLVAPVIAVLAMAVRLDSPGPAIFRQERVGWCGRPFAMYKLRTMRVDDDDGLAIPLQRTAGNDVLFKMREDPRVTRLGRFLRRYSLDELPQLFNVVRGEMSLIGPRPALYEETLKYDSSTWRRAAVKPGITGLWQVSGRSDLSWERSIALDLHYVDNWRLVDDLRIVARTFRAVISKRGAY